MKIEGPGHTLHFHGPGEEAWAESLKLFPLSIFDEEVSTTTEALREALVLTCNADESGLQTDVEHHGFPGTFLGDSFHSSLSVTVRRQILCFQLGRRLHETDPAAAVGPLMVGYLEDEFPGAFRLLVPPEPGTKDADYFRPLYEGFNLLKLAWNSKVLLLLVSARQQSDPQEARKMAAHVVNLTKHDLWDALVAEQGVWGALGLVQRASGYEESARISLGWAVEDNPDGQFSMLELCKSHLESGDIDRALDWVTRAEKGRSATGLQAFVLHMVVLRELGRLGEMTESIDAERHWPREWHDFEPGWMNDSATVELRLQLARILGFADAAPLTYHPAAASPSSAAGIEELVSDLQVPAVWSQLRADASADLRRKKHQISATLEATLGGTWRSLATYQNDLITAEYLFQTFGENPDFSWRGVAQGYFAPVEALGRKIGHQLVMLLPRTAARATLSVARKIPSQVFRLPRESFHALTHILTDASKQSPENRLLLQLPRAVRLNLRSIMNSEDRRRTIRVQEIRNTVHEKEVRKDMVLEMRDLILDPERSVLVFLAAIEAALRSEREAASG